MEEALSTPQLRAGPLLQNNGKIKTLFGSCSELWRTASFGSRERQQKLSELKGAGKTEESKTMDLMVASGDKMELVIDCNQQIALLMQLLQIKQIACKQSARKQIALFAMQLANTADCKQSAGKIALQICYTCRLQQICISICWCRLLHQQN
ncbi:hypothetical protein Fot_35618 [Forsythia ovata]|uniref:Uncharacterized protein n=1 Tax=Forsythia ovata TaxID=205694 RepID=A0ABD1SM20_9LAMI